MQFVRAPRSSGLPSLLRGLAAGLLSVIMGACSVLSNGGELYGVTRFDDAQLTPVQACAIGYDLSKEIYDRVVLREAVVVPARRPTGCEAYTLKYLRQAGFAIDETANAAPLDIQVTDAGEGAVIVAATVGGELRLSRVYATAAEGVYPKSAVSFQRVPRGAKVRPSKSDNF